MTDAPPLTSRWLEQVTGHASLLNCEGDPTASQERGSWGCGRTGLRTQLVCCWAESYLGQGLCPPVCTAPRAESRAGKSKRPLFSTGCVIHPAPGAGPRDDKDTAPGAGPALRKRHSPSTVCCGQTFVPCPPAKVSDCGSPNQQLAPVSQPPSSPPPSPFSSPHVTPGRTKPLPLPEPSVPLTLASEPLQLLFPLPVHSFKRKHVGIRW